MSGRQPRRTTAPAEERTPRWPKDRGRRRLERRVAFWAARQAEAAGRLAEAEAELGMLDLAPES